MNKDQWDSLKEKGAEVLDQVQKKGSEVLDQVQKNEVVKEVSKVAKQNPKEAILATVMALGVIFSFMWMGSLIVGICTGLFVSWNIKDLIRHGKNFYHVHGRFASAMLGLAFIFLLIHTFWFVLGTLVGVTVKLLFQKNNGQSGSGQSSTR